MKNFFLRTIVICALGLLSANCEDGDIGPAGQDGIVGIDGVDGTDGINGTNGQNGVGFDELTKFGSITLTLEGTRPDNIPFTKTDEFKFTSVEDIDRDNNVEIGENTLDFKIERNLSVPDSDFVGSRIKIFLEFTDPGEVDEIIEFELSVDDYTMIFDDLTYFGFNGDFNNNRTEITNFSVTNFNFINETNTVTFSFSFDVDAANNDTGNDLAISGEVNVIVVEDIDDIEL
ncbi:MULTISPECIES: hypothetical protein [Aquimarina]|uniref:Collagen-like protein n=1 Tax=Aquimarina algiphila TaxID=2047982 RepID=A0A554VCW4_9FLAO|nr:MULTISPECIES: hypothetical protein [Aquimarina]TSE04639.1 hypothetical protein FOF46_25740 [Aquimarina algiphila]